MGGFWTELRHMQTYRTQAFRTLGIYNPDPITLTLTPDSNTNT